MDENIWNILKVMRVMGESNFSQIVCKIDHPENLVLPSAFG